MGALHCLANLLIMIDACDFRVLWPWNSTCISLAKIPTGSVWCRTEHVLLCYLLPTIFFGFFVAAALCVTGRPRKVRESPRLLSQEYLLTTIALASFPRYPQPSNPAGRFPLRRALSSTSNRTGNLEGSRIARSPQFLLRFLV